MYIMFIQDAIKFGFLKNVYVDENGAVFGLETDKEKALALSDYNSMYSLKEFIENRFDVTVDILMR